mgnify:CR=1
MFKKKEKTEKKIAFTKECVFVLTFIIGLLVGGLVGIFTMCLFQINK